MKESWLNGYINLLSKNFYDKKEITKISKRITEEINRKAKEGYSQDSRIASYDEIDRIFSLPDCRVSLKIQDRNLMVIKKSYLETGEDISVNIHNLLTGKYNLSYDSYSGTNIENVDSFEEALESAMMYVLLY